MQHDIPEAALACNPLDVLDELGFQARPVNFFLWLSVDKNDHCVNHLDFATTVAGVRQRFLEWAERKLFSEEHQEFHDLSPAAGISCISPPLQGDRNAQSFSAEH